MPNQRIMTPNFLLIWITTFFVFTVFYSLIATLPIYLAMDLDMISTKSGLVIGIFLFASVLFRPFAGKWLDQYSKRAILLISLVIFILSTLFYFFLENFSALLLLRFIHGASFGIATTATGSIVADNLSDERKGEGIGYYALSYNMAMFTGPFLGLFILNTYNSSILFSTLLGLACFSVVTGLLIRIKPSEQPTFKSIEQNSLFNSIVEKKAISASVPGMLLSFAFSGFLTFIPLYAAEIHLTDIAGYFYVTYAVFMVLSRPFVGKLFDRYNSNYVIYGGIGLYAIGLVFLSLAESTFLFLLAAAIIGIGFGGLSPSLQSLAVKSAGSNRSGLATGTYLTFFDIGVGLGSSILGIISAQFGFSLMYFCSAILVLCTALVYYALNRTKKEPQEIKKSVQL